MTRRAVCVLVWAVLLGGGVALEGHPPAGEPSAASPADGSPPAHEMVAWPALAAKPVDPLTMSYQLLKIRTVELNNKHNAYTHKYNCIVCYSVI